MLRQNLWKLLLTLILFGWAVAELIPLKDRPFDPFLQSQVRANPAEFAALMKEAQAREPALKVQSVYLPLRELADEREIDLSRFFPQVRLEASLKNVKKRNSLLMDEMLRRSKGRLPLGLDLKGGVAFTLEVDPKALAAMSAESRKESLTKAIEIISDRINGLGLAEPIVRPVGNNRIEVQLPGVSTRDNPDIAANLRKPARLEFRLVEAGTGSMDQDPGPNAAPPGYEVMSTEDEDRATGATVTHYYFVKRLPEMSGEGLKDAGVQMGDFGGFRIAFSFNSAAAKRFGQITTANVGRLLAVVLDNKLYSAAVIREPITGGNGEISGSFTQREAFELANVLKNPLALPLNIVQQYEVGPSLAQDAIDSGVRAAIIGAALVAGFMILYYTSAGAIAVISVTVNILCLLGVLASLGATMSMPGIAGIVLTIGMAVDAHILIFERMREELALGKTLTAALHAGHDKALTTIVDANLTTLISSGLMIALGNGPVKGFGITLTIGIFTTMFTALIVSQMLLEMGVGSGLLKRIVMFSFLKPPTMDFVGAGAKLFKLSWLIVIIGVVAVFYKGHAIYGIDFAGGDDVTLAFKQRIDTGRIRAALNQAKVGEVNPIYQSDLSGGHEMLTVQTETGRGQEVAPALTHAFPEADYTVVGTTTIGPAVGKEIEWNAFLAIGLSVVGIMLYVAFRFETGYGIGAVVSTIHDVLMTIGIFVLSGRQFSAPMVAGILLIVGYSVNDTVVVFDRIREELKTNPVGSLRDIINLATNKVFNRTILTSLTAFLAALALYVFGGGVVNDLSFTFLVGIVTGTGSSIYIASMIFYWWHKGDRKHVEAHHDIAPKYEWTGTSRASQ